MNDWIEWAGGDCPVADGTVVDVKWRDGSIRTNCSAWGDNPNYESRLDNMSAGFAFWFHDGFDGDIVAYRIVEAPPPPRAQFDAMVPAQEALAIKISADICAGSRPDAVQVLEWAAALYEAEVGAVVMNDWIEWNGGDCPVDGEAYVDVRYRPMEHETAPVKGPLYLRARYYRWQHQENPCDIVAYRTSKDEAE